MTGPLTVLKIGSATLERDTVAAEIAALARRGRLLLVAGGAAGIARHYRALGRPMPMLRLAGGDQFRYCPPAELAEVLAAYEQVVLPELEARLVAAGLAPFVAVAARHGLVTGTPLRPLRVVDGERHRVVRDHRAGVVRAVETAALTALLAAHDVVCLSAPIRADDGGTPLNIDADALAAELALALGADHVRFVTGTAGVLADPADPLSTVREAFPGEAGAFASGRMRQKVRAAERAATGVGDVAVTGPHTLAAPTGWTRFWAQRPPAPDLELLSAAVGIPSVSGDESELAAFLADWAVRRGLPAEVDKAGNLVATRGDGPRRLLLLGHLDTVPHTWPARWRDGALTGRGSVDAKASLVNFLEVLAGLAVPPGFQVRVVGAVEEEISSSKGAFFARDHYPADAVIGGEPSGAAALTLGYHGLLKLRVTAAAATGHSAGRGAGSPADLLLAAVDRLRAGVAAVAPEAASAVIDIGQQVGPASGSAHAVVNFRVPPGVDSAALHAAIGSLGAAGDDVVVQVRRDTPGFAGPRSSQLARAFARAFTRSGVRPRYLVKKGTSDLNTLTTTWADVPMVAYGPGDAALDHTDREEIGAAEYRLARTVLADAVQAWFAIAGEQ